MEPGRDPVDPGQVTGSTPDVYSWSSIYSGEGEVVRVFGSDRVHPGRPGLIKVDSDGELSGMWTVVMGELGNGIHFSTGLVPSEDGLNRWESTP